MRATHWEFKNRALIFGLIFGLSFSLYPVDRQNSTAWLANWLGPTLRVDPSRIARVVFVLAAVLLSLAALIRTWASSYLHSSVVYASAVQTSSLVADGPYRRVRNPLYFANLFLALGLGAMMCRLGFFVAVAAMLLFCYRLIFREESELLAVQGEQYRLYRSVVPRFWPAWRPLVPSGEGKPNWAEGFRSEFWCWGFPVSVAAFAITLNLTAFLVILAVSILLLWLTTSGVKLRGARSRKAAE